MSDPPECNMPDCLKTGWFEITFAWGFTPHWHACTEHVGTVIEEFVWADQPRRKLTIEPLHSET